MSESLLLTGTIAPGAVPFLTLTDPHARLRDYLSAILLWAGSGSVRSICFVENSDFDADYGPLVAACAARNVALEVVRFRGDVARTEARGKGYGDGECIARALPKLSGPFWKVTGRLFVHNHDSVFARHAGDHAFFRNRGTARETIVHAVKRAVGMTASNPRFVFSAMFKATPELYRRVLGGVEDGVDDRGRYYLEHAFRDRLRAAGIATAGVWKDELVVVGRSGSHGGVYNSPLGYADVDAAIDGEVAALVPRLVRSAA